MALAAGARLGPYEILSALGAGGMGEVYRARDVKLNRDVAIKILSESVAADRDRLARFKREAQVLAALNHQNIAHIHGFEDSTGTPALVMELVEGPTLADRIARGPIPIDEALPIAKQIAEALEAAHEQGIIHRDLKPANITVRADGTVKVLDFGLAKALDPPAANDAAGALATSPTITSPALTATGVILGTAAYMSPEQAKGRLVDKRSDIWAFGCVLYEMLTGKRAFAADDVSDTLAAVLRGEPDWRKLPRAPAPALRRLLRRCLDKDPKRRLDSAAAARLEIEDVLSGADVSSAEDSRRRSVWLPVLPWGVASALSIGLVAALLLRTSAQSPSVAARISLSLARDNSLTIGGGTAISPDGRTIAFVARAARGTGLYVRRLDEWEPRALPQTDGALNPFFSPNGQWIAYSHAGGLEKMPAGGGPTQVVCKTGTNIYGGRWQDDGTILFGTWPAALWRVSSGGGAPQLIARANEGSDAWYLWPEPLPGNRGILFTVWQGGRTSVAVLPPGADKPRVLIPSGGRQRYLSSGHLVYVAESHLFAVPFDVQRLAVRGDATIVVDDVNETPITSDYDVSANGVLVYLPAGSSAYEIVWQDRHGLGVPIGTRARPFTSVALAPDGQRFSVNITDGSSRSIWTGSVANGLLTRLTFGNDDVFHLWSPDGTRLYYSVGQHNYNLFSVPTDGSGQPEQLLNSPHPQDPTGVSPDGDTILFNDVDPSTKSDIWELSLSRKTSRPVIRTPFVEAGAVFSPDGHWIAYQSDESGQSEVYVQAYPGVGQKRRVSLDGGRLPFWGHTGRELFYQTATAMFAVPIENAREMRFGTAQRLFLKTKGTQAGRYTSLDDQRFLMIEKAETNQSSQLNVVQNWLEELKARVPTK